jgi:hypothetical protein
VRRVVLDLEIEQNESGYLLIASTRESGFSASDNWFESLESAEQAAFEWLGVPSSRWERP